MEFQNLEASLFDPGTDYARPKPNDSLRMHGAGGTCAMIRPMTLEDKNQVMAVENSSNWHPWTWEQFGLTHLKKTSVRNTVYESGGILGYLCSSVTPHEAEIQNICVDINHRGKKIASRLLEDFIQWCEEKGPKEIYLEVREKNTAAKGLYRKYHFDLMDIRKNYYSHPEDNALCYCLKLA